MPDGLAGRRTTRRGRRTTRQLAAWTRSSAFCGGSRSSTQVQVISPRSSGLLRDTARATGVVGEARLGSRVGRVGRYDRAAAPHMRVGPRGRALSRVQRPPQWLAARAGGADVMPTSGLGQTPPVRFSGSRRYRTIKVASRGDECESVVYSENTRNACEPFAFNRRELLVPSSLRS